MAIFMSKNGLTKDNIMTEGAEVSYPDSVVDYFLGNIGQPEGGFPADLQKIVLKGQKPSRAEQAHCFLLRIGKLSKSICMKHMH